MEKYKGRDVIGYFDGPASMQFGREITVLTQEGKTLSGILIAGTFDICEIFIIQGRQYSIEIANEVIVAEVGAFIFRKIEERDVFEGDKVKTRDLKEKRLFEGEEIKGLFRSPASRWKEMVWYFGTLSYSEESDLFILKDYSGNIISSESFFHPYFFLLDLTDQLRGLEYVPHVS